MKKQRLLKIMSIAALVGASSPASAQYSFVDVADTSTVAPFTSFFPPAINGGPAAFVATYPANPFGFEEIFTGSGAALTPIAMSGDTAPVGLSPAPTFTHFGAPAIDGPTAAFVGNYTGGGSAIFTGSGGPLTVIAMSGNPTPSPFIGAPSFGALTIIDANGSAFSGGTAAFHAYNSLGGQGIFTKSSGGTLTTIARTDIPESALPPLPGPSPGRWFGFGTPPAISGSTVAFRGIYNGGVGEGVFVRAGGLTGFGTPALTTIIKRGDPAPGGTVYFGFSPPSISGGKVAFVGVYGPSGGSPTGAAILKWDAADGSLVIIAKTGVPAPLVTFDNLFMAASISGDAVAFQGFYNGRADRGIFVWHDGVAGPVITTGCPLFGSHPTSLSLLTFGLDAAGSGKIAFSYALADESRTSGVAIATPATLSITCAPDKTIECPAAPVFDTPVPDDGCGIVSLSPSDVRLSGDCASGGHIMYAVKRTWTAMDAWGNTTHCSQTISVQDTTPPTISSPPDPVSLQCASQIPAAGTLPANDNCAGSLTATASDGPPVGNVPCNYTITRTWNVSDACGNAATPVTQLITVMDTTPPSPHCPDNLTILTGPGPVTYTATATDLCDPSPTITFVPPSGSTCPLGTTTVTCTAKDVCGNTATCTFTVTVTFPGGLVNGSFCTLSQGAFGSPTSYGYMTYLEPNFSALYSSGVAVGHVGGNYYMAFKSAGAVANYLPASGAPDVLTDNWFDPTTTIVIKGSRTMSGPSPGGSVGGQVLALRLNRDLSNAGVTPAGFGSVTLCNLVDDDAEDTTVDLTVTQAAALNGQTVNQVLADAENMVGGSGAVSAYGLDVKQLNELVGLLNLSFDASFTDAAGASRPCGAISPFATAHFCPP